MGGIALTIFGVAWWCPWVQAYNSRLTLFGNFVGLGCAVAGVVCAFLGH